VPNNRPLEGLVHIIHDASVFSGVRSLAGFRLLRSGRSAERSRQCTLPPRSFCIIAGTLLQSGTPRVDVFTFVCDVATGAQEMALEESSTTDGAIMGRVRFVN
jgi:hypothetical protein